MKLKCSDIHLDVALNKSRLPFSLDSCESLAESIRDDGQDLAVKVTEGSPDGKLYTLRVGFRRFTAIHLILGWEEIEADIVEYATEEAAALANFRENLERQDLGYFEECRALRDIFPADTSLQALSKKLHRSRHWVRCRWQLWELEPEIILGVETGNFTPSDIALMLGKNRKEQLERADAIRLGKSKGETRDEIAAKVGRKRSRPSKKDVGKMLTFTEEQMRKDATYALLWSIGEIDNEEFIDY